MTSLNMKRVLITGAARGLGRAMAESFAAEGAEVVLTDLDAEGLDDAREALSSAGARCRTYVLDVTDPAAIAEAREALHADAGTVDILVNNAGVVFGGEFLEVPLEKHHLTYRVNVEGPVNMTHAFLEDVIGSPRGHLVYIASASGYVGLPGGTTYASSKWAAIGFAESIRAELKHQGHRRVGVTTVCPTYIATGMFEGVAPPKTTSMLDPARIAAKVVTAVKRRKVWVREPWIVKITPLLKHGLPTPVSDFLSDAFGASKSMDHWQGHGKSGE
ncbi:MAG: SDR family oxidoreductase [bacterium]|nr:SDR family oxidoreductase [bacterium]